MLYANSPVPLYKQLYNRLRGAIEGGQFRTGRQMPSERRLAAEYGISRPTARKALDLLQEEGYIQAFPGKGSYVAHGTQLTSEKRPLEGFSELVLKQGLTPRSERLSSGIVTVSGDIAQYLQIGDSQEAVKIRRLRFVNDVPVAIETAYLRYPMCGAVLNADLEKHSLYRYLEEKLQIKLAYATQTIQGVLGQGSDLRLLGLKSPAAVIQMKRQTYDTSDRVIEYVEVIYRESAENFKLPAPAKEH